MCLISNAGGNISLLADNSSCYVAEKGSLIVLMIASLLALLAAVIHWILILAFDCIREEKEELISLKDLQKNEEMKREEEALSKHF
jgi:hypothetical protein